MSFADSVLQSQSFEWLTILFVLWLKSIFILTVTSFLGLLLRPARARFRHTLWCAALFSLLFLPIISGSVPVYRVPALPSSLLPSDGPTRELLQANSREASSQLSNESEAYAGQSSVAPADQQPRSALSWQSIVLLVWLIGTLAVLARFIVGIVIVRRLVSRSTELTGPWSKLSSELSREIQLKRRVRLLRSDRSLMPVTCGSLSAKILLPTDAGDWSADRKRVVLLHELIHVKRKDILVQAIGQIVCALYWFNPLVWLAVKKLRTEQEWACDESVVATGIAAPEYAGQLLEIARRFDTNMLSTVATTGMASSSELQDRLCAILDPVHQKYWSGRTIAVSALMMFVLVSMAVVRFVPAQRQDEMEVSTVADAPPPVTQIELSGSIKQQSKPVASVKTGENPALQQTPSATPTPVAQPASEIASPVPVQVALDVEPDPLIDFTAEERERLASERIGPAYIKEMVDAGYRQLTVDQLTQLHSNSVRADYIVGLRSVGYDNISIRDLLSLKTNGITPDVIRSYQAVKHASFEAKKYVALVTNGVTPSYLKSLADTGYDYLTANKAIEMRLAGITSDFIAEARSRGYVNLSPNDLIELKRREKG